MRNVILIVSFLMASLGGLFSQNVNYAHQIIDTLCSPSMAGRGYAFDHDGKAANYIASQFKADKLKKFTPDYFQSFTLNVNVLNGKMLLALGTDTLEAGADYLALAQSKTLKGKFELIYLDAKLIKNKTHFDRLMTSDLSQMVLLVDTAGLNQPDFRDDFEQYFNQNSIGSKAVIKITDGNLLHVPGRYAANFAEFIVKRESLPSKIPMDVTIDVDSEYLENEPTQNVIAYIKGRSDSALVFSAHYDHVGMMGTAAYFPGANDNASGTAMVLNLAHYFSSQKRKPKYTMVFMLFTGEEIGLLGSKYYTEHPLFPLSKIKFLVNLDMVGSGDKGIRIVNGSVFRPQFDNLVRLNDAGKFLLKVDIRGAAANSDHYFFYDKGVPSFFIYTQGAYKEYHNIYDTADKVPLMGYEGLFNLLVEFVGTF